ncbi:hypothetical protein EC960932_3010, partial [Escherichia coli 96.0932]
IRNSNSLPSQEKSTNLPFHYLLTHLRHLIRE